MPRSRGSEMPQRQSPRVPLQLRTSTSNSDPLPQRPVAGRSPKLGDHRSPRGAQSSSVNQKKLGSRLAVLESQLGNAQEELKILKGQLASAEAAKKEAQEKLKKTPKPILLDPVEIEEKRPPSIEMQESNKEDNSVPYEIPDVNQQETDVFEVPLEKMTMGSIAKLDQPANEDCESKPVSISTESPAIPEPEKPSFVDLALKNDDINSLKANLEEKKKELEVFCQENESLKRQLNETSLEMSSARAKEEEMTIRLSQLEQQLGESKATAILLTEKLETVEGAKEALEAEMKKMKVQTEQWRKAADAAATVLAGGVEFNGKKMSERCGSMDKHFSSMFEIPVGGFAGFMGSPGQADDSDDGYGSGKRKGSGIRMFGDLWRKKGHK